MKKDNKNNKTYSKEQRDSLVKQMLPPQSQSITVLSEETGIPKSTLAGWKARALKTPKSSTLAPLNKKALSSREKFLIVIETYTMSEIQLSEYCRAKGLYVDEVKKWRISCVAANDIETPATKELKQEIQEEKKRAKHLEKDLRRKEKALAETAALLVLQKKLNAIWGDQEEE